MAKIPKNDSPILLDASAFIAVVLNEAGASRVEAALDHGASISSVNLSESITKLQEYGYTPEELHAAVEDMPLSIIPFAGKHAFLTSTLQPYIRSHNLSLGDRACLAVGMEGGYAVLTADKLWEKLPLNLSIQLIR